MVNNCRRLFPAYRQIHDLLRSGEFGTVTGVEIRDGSPFDWNSVSDFYLRDPQRAKGVFLDRGAHTVDIVCWWLSGRPRVVESYSDAMGGAEGLMKVRLALDKATIRLTFSRFYKLENTYMIECEKASIVGRLFNASKFAIVRNGRRQPVVAGQPAALPPIRMATLGEFHRRCPARLAATVHGRGRGSVDWGDRRRLSPSHAVGAAVV